MKAIKVISTTLLLLLASVGYSYAQQAVDEGAFTFNPASGNVDPGTVQTDLYVNLGSLDRLTGVNFKVQISGNSGDVTFTPNETDINAAGMSVKSVSISNGSDIFGLLPAQSADNPPANVGMLKIGTISIPATAGSTITSTFNPADTYIVQGYSNVSDLDASVDLNLSVGSSANPTATSAPANPTAAPSFAPTGSIAYLRADFDENCSVDSLDYSQMFKWWTYNPIKAKYIETSLKPGKISTDGSNVPEGKNQKSDIKNSDLKTDISSYTNYASEVASGKTPEQAAASSNGEVDSLDYPVFFREWAASSTGDYTTYFNKLYGVDNASQYYEKFKTHCDGVQPTAVPTSSSQATATPQATSVPNATATAQPTNATNPTPTTGGGGTPTAVDEGAFTFNPASGNVDPGTVQTDLYVNLGSLDRLTGVNFKVQISGNSGDVTFTPNETDINAAGMSVKSVSISNGSDIFGLLPAQSADNPPANVGMLKIGTISIPATAGSTITSTFNPADTYIVQGYSNVGKLDKSVDLNLSVGSSANPTATSAPANPTATAVPANPSPTSASGGPTAVDEGAFTFSPASGNVDPGTVQTDLYVNLGSLDRLTGVNFKVQISGNSGDVTFTPNETDINAAGMSVKSVSISNGSDIFGLLPAQSADNPPANVGMLKIGTISIPATAGSTITSTFNPADTYIVQGYSNVSDLDASVDLNLQISN